MLHSLVRLYEGQPLSPIRQILGIHSSHIYGRVENEIGKDLECDTIRFLRMKQSGREVTLDNISTLGIANGHPLFYQLQCP